MRDRVSIRKTAPGTWTITRPRAGFGGPEVLTAESQAAAVARLDRIRAALHVGSTVVQIERRQHATDALNPVSPWTPLWVPGTEPHVLPYNQP
ncbi:hypothetical protein [Saccharothrix xinjiangensis]|uniref:DUF2188 domain-containing protein n=1 Tax=Saccharothrix xinjiangensis TaxID=204798 RepID=A0ABV9XW06_9PSEU